MAIGYLHNAKLHVGAADLSGLASQVSLPVSVAELNNTPIDTTGWETYQGGLIKATIDFTGWREFGTGLSDQLLFAGLATAEVPVSVWMPSAADGGLAFMSRLNQFSYAPAAKVGDLEAYTVAGPLVWPLVRGNSLVSGAKTANGSSTPLELGAVSASQYAYAVLHVTAFSGFTNLDVRIQSDTTALWPSPIDRFIWNPITAVAGYWATPVAGAITDTFWRAVWTVTGAGSATIAVAMGIQ